MSNYMIVDNLFKLGSIPIDYDIHIIIAYGTPDTPAEITKKYKYPIHVIDSYYICASGNADVIYGKEGLYQYISDNLGEAPQNADFWYSLDSLPSLSLDVYRIILDKEQLRYQVVASGDSTINLFGSACAKISGNAHAQINKGTKAELHGHATAEVKYNGQVLLYDESKASLFDDAKATLYDNSHAVIGGAQLKGDYRAALYGNSTAHVLNDCKVKLCQNAKAKLFDSAYAELYDKSFAELYDQSQAVSWGGSHTIMCSDTAHVDCFSKNPPITKTQMQTLNSTPESNQFITENAITTADKTKFILCIPIMLMEALILLAMVVGILTLLTSPDIYGLLVLVFLFIVGGLIGIVIYNINKNLFMYWYNKKQKQGK